MIRERRTIKYVLYARKSSESEDRQVQSIDDQITRLEQLAAEQGLQITKVYTEARSAKLPNDRPVFANMLRDIERGNAQGILCWQINRLSRNPVDSGAIGWLLQRGVLRSIQTVEREYLPEDNVLLFNLETGMANQYVIDLSKNVRRGIQGKLERGEKPGLAPCGYLNDLRTHKIVKDPERFATVRQAWDWLLSGDYSILHIWQKLNAVGFTTIRRERIGGGQVALSALARMFSNPFYAGLIVHQGKEYVGAHEPMISLEEYDKAQAILGRNGRVTRGRLNFAFTRLIRCGECGCYITAERKTKKINKNGDTRSYTYYHCSLRKTNKRCSQRRYMSEQNLLDQINKQLRRYRILPQFVTWTVEYINDIKARDTEHIRQRQTQVLTIEKKLANLNQMRYSDLISDDEYRRDKQCLSNELACAKTQLEQIDMEWDNKIKELLTCLDAAAYIGERMISPKIENEQKRRLIKNIGSNLKLTDKTLSFTPFPPIQTAVALTRRYRRFEPIGNGLHNTKKDAFASLKILWQGWLDRFLNQSQC